MNKYSKLANNTIIFAISTFSSKLMVFLLMPMYTRLLSTADYGVMDIIVNTCNLLIPLVYVSIHEAVIRFAIDKSVRKKDVFTVGINTCFKGFLIFLPAVFLLKMNTMLSDYAWLIYLYIVSACLRSVCCQFTRGIGLVKLYATDGIVATFSVLAFNLIFMLKMHMGVRGYVLSVILSNFLSVILLFLFGHLGKYLIIGSESKKLKNQMIRYSVPLIPTTIFWWIMNVSDRYIVKYYQGADVTGIYSASYKIPTIITLLSSIFAQAWQLSAISEYEDKEKDDFYSNVFSYLQAATFMAASGIIMLVKPFTMILVEKSYYSAYNYTPILVFAVIFSCFSTFFSSFYMASKKNNMSLVTTFVGAALNIILNFMFIPKIGAKGAAVATLLSYFVVFVFRIIDTRRFVKLKINYVNMLLNIAAISLQTAVTVIGVKHNWLLQMMLCLFVVMLNLRVLVFGVLNLIKMKKKGKQNNA